MPRSPAQMAVTAAAQAARRGPPTKMVSVRLPIAVAERLSAEGQPARKIIAALEKFWGEGQPGPKTGEE